MSFIFVANRRRSLRRNSVARPAAAIFVCSIYGAHLCDASISGAHAQEAAPDVSNATATAAVSTDETSESLSVEAGFSHESLTDGFDSWRSQYLLLIKKWEQRKAAYGSLTRVERFGRRDSELLGGVYLPLGTNTTLNLEASASSSHRVLARWSAYGQVAQRIGKNRYLNAGFRHSEYNSSDVSTPHLGLEQYFGRYRASYTLFLPELEGRRTRAHLLQGNYYYDKSNVGLSFSFGEETDIVAPGTLATFRVRGAAISGLHFFKSDWALNYRLGITRQGDLYSRRGLSLGLRHEF
jgi:YaiO family outer membrane protein